jgi:hypothetical protein
MILVGLRSAHPQAASRRPEHGHPRSIPALQESMEPQRIARAFDADRHWFRKARVESLDGIAAVRELPMTSWMVPGVMP